MDNIDAHFVVFKQIYIYIIYQSQVYRTDIFTTDRLDQLYGNELFKYCMVIDCAMG